MELRINESEISKSVDQFKNVVGQNLFDLATGTIKGALENSGVEIKSNAVPIAKNESQAQPEMNLKPVLLLVLGVGVGFLILKKLKKSGRV